MDRLLQESVPRYLQEPLVLASRAMQAAMVVALSLSGMLQVQVIYRYPLQFSPSIF